MAYIAPKKFDEDKYLTDIKVDRNDISSVMAEHASLSAYYGVQHARWEGTYSLLKMRVETFKSQTELKLRKELEEELGKKPTENMVKSALVSHPDYEEYQQKLVKAEEQVILFKNALDAFKQRRDMVTSIGHDLRLEKQGEISVQVAQARQSGTDPASVKSLVNRANTLGEKSA